MLRFILTLGECQSRMDLDSLIHVLSLALRDEYRLFTPKPSETIAPDVQPWVHKYPLAWAETAGMGLARDKDGWYRDQNNNLILPATLGRLLCEHLHTSTHLGERKSLTLLQTACLRVTQQNATVRERIQARKACQLMRTEKKQHSGMRN